MNKLARKIIKLLSVFYMRLFRPHHPKGKLIAFVGMDGSGKTTLTRKLSEISSQERPVTYIYLGLGSGDLGRRIGRLPFLGKVLESKLNNKARTTRTKGEKIPGTLTALVVYSFSLKRYLNHYRMQHALEVGVTVVTDRYPQAEIPGICDGPGLSAARPGNRFVAWLARSEARMYRRMASCRPNLIIRLDVSPAIAHARKPDHDLRLLELKSEAMKALSFDGAPLISVNAAEPFETVWKIVSSRAQSLLMTDLIGCRPEEVTSYI